MSLESFVKSVDAHETEQHPAEWFAPVMKKLADSGYKFPFELADGSEESLVVTRENPMHFCFLSRLGTVFARVLTGWWGATSRSLHVFFGPRKLSLAKRKRRRSHALRMLPVLLTLWQLSAPAGE